MALDIKNIKLDTIMKLQLSRKLIILVVIHLIFIGLYYYFLYNTKIDQLAKLNSQLTAINKEVADKSIIAADIPRFRREKEELEISLKKALAQLPNKKEIPSLINGISDALKSSGLDIVVFRPLQERPKGFYADVPVSMQVNGRFESLYQFFSNVRDMPRIVNIGNIKVLSKGGDGEVILGVDFQATTFRFIEQAEER